MLESYFSPVHQAALVAAIGAVLAASWLQWRERQRWALLLLTAAAFVLRLFAATLDPFLNEWDECFHALVAKRMLDDPLTPRLFAEGVLPTSTQWTQSGLWLHKPPFFLWQITTSLAIFGIEPWTVRMPSVLWLTLMVPVTYRMGCLLAGRRVAWTAALLTACSYYMLELTAGAINTDHNDAIFIALVCCSWWALLELWNDDDLRWALLVGLFAAAAILTKLFVGAVVFLPWFVVALRRRDRAAWKAFLLGAGLTVLLCAAWFGSLALRFPDALRAQWAFDIGHLAEVVEGHAGGWAYHLLVIGQLMPPLVWWVVVPACVHLVRSAKRWEHRALVAVLLVAIHAAFGWADTKMVSFTMVLFPIYLIAVGSALVSLADTFIVARHRRGALLLSTLVLAGFFLNLEVLQHRHTLASPPKRDQHWRQQQMEAMPVLRKLADLLPDSVPSVVYHVPALHHVQFMFHAGVEATDQMPVPADVQRLGEQGYAIYAVQDGAPIEHFPPGVVVIGDEDLLFPDAGRPD